MTTIRNEENVLRVYRLDILIIIIIIIHKVLRLFFFKMQTRKVNFNGLEKVLRVFDINYDPIKNITGKALLAEATETLYFTSNTQ